MTNIKAEILTELVTEASSYDWQSTDYDKLIDDAQIQLQKAFEEAVEEIIGTEKECICEEAGTELCDNHWSLRNQQRTKAKQVIKEMF